VIIKFGKRLVGWLVGWLVGRSVGLLVAWLFGWLVGCLVCQFVGVIIIHFKTASLNLF
jgi:chromate transport protein ChrA